MRFGKLIAVPIALLGSQAIAENWVNLDTDKDGVVTSVDKNSIRRGSDGLVYFAEYYDDDDYANAADCPRRLLYMIKDQDGELPDWHDHGKAVRPNSVGETVLQYVCANAG